jgi:hypothetical protein
MMVGDGYVCVCWGGGDCLTRAMVVLLRRIYIVGRTNTGVTNSGDLSADLSDTCAVRRLTVVYDYPFKQLTDSFLSRSALT